MLLKSEIVLTFKGAAKGLIFRSEQTNLKVYLSGILLEIS